MSVANATARINRGLGQTVTVARRPRLALLSQPLLVTAARRTMSGFDPQQRFELPVIAGFATSEVQRRRQGGPAAFRVVFGAGAAARAAEHLAPPSLLVLLHQRLEEGHEHAGPAQPLKRFRTLLQSSNSAGSVRAIAL